MFYPTINPVAFSIGPLSVHWYGMMYLIGFLGAWLLLQWRVKHIAYPPYSLFSSENISDIIFYGALGVVLGGRIGYIFLYNVETFLNDPLIIFKIWQGGMSFHGGLIGVLLAMFLYSRKIKCDFIDIMDFIAPVVPIGLGAGRIGNFINGELWGRVTDVPWGMVFPHAGPLARHPSELYEFLLEGVLFFILLWGYSRRPRRRYTVSGLFLIGYGTFRFFVEFFREPDSQLGYILFGTLTMGQLLSLPMILVGLLFFYKKWGIK